jgi:two-component SAPR family response regulator
MKSGLRILIVEDQYLVADAIKKAVIEAGGEVVGPTPRLEQALKFLEKRAFDIALVDVNLGDETAYPFAEALEEAKVPYIFVTGYDVAAIRPNFRHRPMLEKPFSPDALAALVAGIDKERRSTA